MMRQRSASPPAAFAEDWIDGDIHGLQALASALYGHAFQITDVMSVLDQQVSRLAPAGSMFASSWRRDSITAEALATVVVQAAAIIDGLAVELAAIENALEEEAYVASRYGVTIGTDGQPPPVSPEPDVDLSGRALAGRLQAGPRTSDGGRAAGQAAGRPTAHSPVRAGNAVTEARHVLCRTGNPYQLLTWPADVEPRRLPLRSQGCVIGARGRHLKIVKPIDRDAPIRWLNDHRRPSLSMAAARAIPAIAPRAIRNGGFSERKWRLRGLRPIPDEAMAIRGSCPVGTNAPGSGPPVTLASLSPVDRRLSRV